jgi:NADPH:quinone reductase-like Zn-dependent oxidoreductase
MAGMKAAVRDRYGPPEIVQLAEVDTPVPAGDQVLVRVHAASVNRADLDGLYPRWQFTRLFSGLRRPRDRGIGLDVAGVVEAVGPEAQRFTPGDAVFGDLFAFGQGAFAEYACAPERAFQPMPPGLSFEEASTLPHSAVLALQALRLRNGRSVEAGDRVLVEGASGSVGPFVVQVAKSMGAEVTGICRGDKVDFVRSLGADHVIDYTAVDYTAGDQRYDWIVAADAHHSLPASRRALTRRGAFVALGGSGGWMLSSAVITPAIRLASGRFAGVMLWWKPFHPPDVDRLRELVEAGVVKPAIDRTYPLDEVVSALRYVDDGHARGKVVIAVA